MINVTLGEVKPQEVKTFPKLMIANEKGNKDEGIIVLFYQEKCGIVLKAVEPSIKDVGYYSIYFDMNCFDNYNEPITIQNA